MADIDEQQIEVLLRRILLRHGSQTDRVECPDEESLAIYLSDNLADAERGKMEEHLSRCSFCLDVVAAVHQAMRETSDEKAPRSIMERAMRLVRPAAKESVAGLVVRLVKDAVELVSGAGEWIVPSVTQLAPVRGAAVGAAGIVQVEKEIGEYKVAVDVEQVETGTCQVAITLTTADAKPADGVRVSLMVGEREQASFLTRQGQAVFTGVGQGDYKLAISRVTGVVATINLTIAA
jgi:hypothetical protein